MMGWKSSNWSKIIEFSTTASQVHHNIYHRCRQDYLFYLFILFLRFLLFHFFFTVFLNLLNTGATVVEWLVSKGKARNSPEALMLATGLLNEGFLQPAGDLSKEGAETAEQTAFLDDTKALYYFVSKTHTKNDIQGLIFIKAIHITCCFLCQG